MALKLIGFDPETQLSHQRPGFFGGKRFRTLLAASQWKAALCGSGFQRLQRDYPRAEASFVGFNGLIQYFRSLNLGRKESPTVRHIQKHFAL